MKQYSLMSNHYLGMHAHIFQVISVGVSKSFYCNFDQSFKIWFKNSKPFWRYEQYAGWISLKWNAGLRKVRLHQLACTKLKEVARNLNENKKNSFYVSRLLKNELKANDFSHPITKARFHIRYFLEGKKICNSVVPDFFPTPSESLRLSFIKTDILWITSLRF